MARGKSEAVIFHQSSVHFIAAIKKREYASIGSLNYLALNGVGVGSAPLAGNIPHLIYMAFQLVFAAVTLAISACAVYETGPRHNGWGFHDRGDRGWHDGRGWR